MAEKEIKAFGEIIANKTKFKRIMYIIIALCVTVIVIAGIGFYTGAINVSF